MTRIASLALLLLCAAGVCTAHADEKVDDDKIRQRIFERALRSTVWIVFPAEEGGFRLGTGVLLDKRERLILLLSQHFEDEPKEIRVFFPMFDERGEVIREKQSYFGLYKEGKGHRAKLLHKDDQAGLALIQLDTSTALKKEIEPITLATSNPDVGQVLYSVGNPGISDSLWIFGVTKVQRSRSERCPI